MWHSSPTKLEGEVDILSGEIDALIPEANRCVHKFDFFKSDVFVLVNFFFTFPFPLSLLAPERRK